MGAPVTGDGATSGEILVVVVNIDASDIGAFVQQIMLGDTGYVEIVDQNGAALFRTEPARPEAGQDVLAAVSLTAADWQIVVRQSWPPPSSSSPRAMSSAGSKC